MMKLTTLAVAALATALFTGCECEKCERGEHASQADLQAQAKISKETATATALAKVPNGTIKEGELEKEKGKLIWSFDVTTPDSKDIKEVNVDALTGDVVSVDTETPEDQAKEAAEDKKKEKDGKEDKD